MDGELYMSKRNIIKDKNKNVVIVDEEQCNECSDTHKLLDEVIQKTKEWANVNIQEQNLIVQNIDEYICLMKFREVLKIQRQMLTKKISDQFEVQTRSILHVEKPVEIKPHVEEEEKVKKKSRFRKNK